jgi:hypothetical protein
MSADNFDGGGWMTNWGNSGVNNPWQTPAPAPAAAPAAAPAYGGGFAPQQDLGGWNPGTNMSAGQAPTNMGAAATTAANNWFGSASAPPPAPAADQGFGGFYDMYNTGAGTTTNSTRPTAAPGTQAPAAAAPQGGTPATGAYRTPDWLRNSALMLDQTPETQAAFFAANPQYKEDWDRIRAGGNSAFATDGSTLVRSNFNNMSPEAAAYYRDNQAALLANEGFGHDPTLAYMNYFGGAGSIGANAKDTNMSTYLQNNRWTPNGIQGGANNPLMYARTAYGAGTASMRQGQGGQPGGGSPGSGAPTGGVYPQPYGGGGSPGAGAPTGGVYPQPYGGIGGGAPTGGVMPAPGGGGSFSMSSGPAGQNPYLQQMGDVMAGQMTQNFNRNVMPRLNSQAMASGGMGGSRQGVLEANAVNDLNTQVGNALTNLYGSGFNTSLNYDLGLRNNATAYDLGLRNNQLGWGNLDLGYANLDRNINNDNNNWQLQGANFGLGLQDRLMGYGQVGLGIGNQINDQAYQNWLRFSQGANSLGNGYGTSTGSQTQPGNVIGGALGGAQLGSRIGNWWGGQGGGGGGANWYSGNQGMGD